MATKFWTAAAFLLIGLCASAQSFWDGNAALQRGDPSFENGSFAASNSFPTGTKIVVENLETGKSAEVEVSRRAGEQSDLLVLLSPKAAAALGIPAGQIAAVRVTLKRAETAQAETGTGDDILSRDPDINPAAGMAAAPEKERQPEAEHTGTLESLPGAAVSESSESPAPEEEPSIAPQAPSADEELLKQLASRSPQKQLFLPPREDEKFVYQPPIEPPPEAATISSLKGRKPPTEPAKKPPVAVAEPAAAPEVNGSTARAPANESKTVVALEPAAPKPPAETPAPAKNPEAKPAPAPAAPLTGAKTVYYLQLGAYSNENQAKDLATGLSSSYPVSVSAPQASGARYYRVLLGPLNKAESGTLLYWFRDRGFPDAFIKRER
jgi:cell division protein FtsN